MGPLARGHQTMAGHHFDHPFLLALRAKRPSIERNTVGFRHRPGHLDCRVLQGKLIHELLRVLCLKLAERQIRKLSLDVYCSGLTLILCTLSFTGLHLRTDNILRPSVRWNHPLQRDLVNDTLDYRSSLLVPLLAVGRVP